MREAGEPMECGIFDFYKVFSRAFGDEEDGVGGSSSGRWGNVVNDTEFHFVRFNAFKWMLMNDLDCGYFDLYRIFNVNTI